MRYRDLHIHSGELSVLPSNICYKCIAAVDYSSAAVFVSGDLQFSFAKWYGSLSILHLYSIPFAVRPGSMLSSSLSV